MKLENENEYLDERLGKIILRTNGDDGHFVYKVNGKNYGGAQTTILAGYMGSKKKIASHEASWNGRNT
ncbi:hypothetical protein AGMMS49921_06150 [Endomicrobiia bacterium]|nr:hypothetical protein AGMMS49921_06150 [Endomicrobiia bacterium]